MIKRIAKFLIFGIAGFFAYEMFVNKQSFSGVLNKIKSMFGGVKKQVSDLNDAVSDNVEHIEEVEIVEDEEDEGYVSGAHLNPIGE